MTLHSQRAAHARDTLMSSNNGANEALSWMEPRSSSAVLYERMKG